MKLSEKQQELIQKYLSNTLSAKDQALFDTEKQGIDFKNELLAQTELLNDIEVSSDKELKAKLRAMDVPATVGKPESSTPTPKSNNSWIKIIALLAIILGGAFLAKNLLTKNEKAFSSDQLFAEYYQVMPAEMNERGTAADTDANFQEAMELYALKNYKESLEVLDQKNEKSTKNQLYKALCHIELNQLEDAKSQLLPILKATEIQERQNAEWYLALIHLKQSNLSSCKESLNKILGQTDHLFLQKAQKLSEDLN